MKEVEFFKTRLILYQIDLWEKEKLHVKTEDLEIDSLQTTHFLSYSLENFEYPRNIQPVKKK